MNICELIDNENNSNTQQEQQQQQQQQGAAEDPPQHVGEDKSQLDEASASAAAAATSTESTSDNQTSSEGAAVAAAAESSSNEFMSSFSTGGEHHLHHPHLHKSSGVDDDDDNSVYNRMIMFVNSNESSDYGSSSDQENSSASSSSSETHHDNDDDDDFNSSKGGGLYSGMMLNNNDENQNQYQLGQHQSSSAQQQAQFSILSSSIDEECQFDLLNPIEKFFKLCENPTPSNIEAASKYVVPALEFASSQEDYARIFFYLRQYCFYSDVLLRSLWLEQIQNVISYLHQELDNIRVEFTEDFSMAHSLANIINDLMREQAYQVKKCATSSILYIIEKQLLTNIQIEQLIIPSILNLVKENNEDFHIDCVSLFGKLSPLLGQEMTSKYFLQPFCRLCTSSVFHTRKACAANIAEIANVVSIDEVENDLLPHFCEFMKDQMWAIRKVCADSFSQFALRCRRETREGILTEHFVRLLDDNSRWVKISAYKSLGPFIATFIRSDAEKAEIAAAAAAMAKAEEEKKAASDEDKVVKEEESKTLGEDDVVRKSDVGDEGEEKKHVEDIIPSSPSSAASNEEDVHMVDVMSTQEHEKTNTTDEDAEGENSSPNKNYSQFMYWRTPQESIPINSSNDESAKTSAAASSTVDQENRMESSNENKSSSTSSTTLPTLSNLLNSSNLLETPLNKVTIYSSSNNLSISSQFGQSTTSIEQLSSELKQDIVPPTLLGHFISMVDINTQNSLDSEMNYNCAFNFPAIALTLGVEHWKYIKGLYKRLAEDVSWKVRQTLAYSIHELAVILGTEYTQTDLVPIFDSYVKDVDEVRIGIVANLTKFLSVLSLDYRRSYMPKLNDFLKMDNQRNWRFRNELGLQIAEFCPLLPAECLAEYVQPVAFTLALDKISEVRLTAINALIEIFKEFELKKKLDLRRNFVDDVIRTFANSNRWTFRQLYVVMCENLLKSKDSQQSQVDFDAFCHDFLPKLFSFRNEKVPNIRILLARFISTYLVNNEYFVQAKSSQLASELDLTVHYLANDKENDVRSYFASIYCKQLELTNDESRQSVSADVSMEVVPSNLAASAEIKSEHDSTDLPKIDTSSVVLAASPHETFATETSTFEYEERKSNQNVRSYFASIYCKQLELTNDESRQSVSADVSMEVVPSNLAASAEIKSEHDSTDLPKIDTSSVVLAASPHETFATETSTFEYEERKSNQNIEITPQEQQLEDSKRNDAENSSNINNSSNNENDDDDEEWDEVVDKTKIDKLKIVNLDNEMDDEMDIIIESKDSITRLNQETSRTSSNVDETGGNRNPENDDTDNNSSTA